MAAPGLTFRAPPPFVQQQPDRRLERLQHCVAFTVYKTTRTAIDVRWPAPCRPRHTRACTAAQAVLNTFDATPCALNSPGRHQLLMPKPRGPKRARRARSEAPGCQRARERASGAPWQRRCADRSASTRPAMTLRSTTLMMAWRSIARAAPARCRAPRSEAPPSGAVSSLEGRPARARRRRTLNASTELLTSDTRGTTPPLWSRRRARHVREAAAHTGTAVQVHTSGLLVGKLSISAATARLRFTLRRPAGEPIQAAAAARARSR